jgi:hypothetical protein
MKSEIQLSEELGMDRRVIRDIRMNVLTADSWTKEGNRVVYTKNGEHALRNEIQKELASQELSDPLPELEEKEFTITHIPFNRRMVISDGVKIRVSDNKNFLTGMKVRARPPVSEGEIWVMLGRCPRWRGRY